MARLITTQSLISAVRSKIDAANTTDIDDLEDILPALNRGLDDACNLLARQYDSPLMDYEQFTTTTAQDYPIPDDAFEDRVEKVEYADGQRWVEIPRMNIRDMTLLDSNNLGATGQIPVAHAIYGRSIRLTPIPLSGKTIRVWYLKEPDQLVLPQGRITRVNVSSSNIFVDSVGDGLSADVDSLEAFVNFVDSKTGVIKGTGQVLWVNGESIQFKTSIATEYQSLMGKSVTAMSGFDSAPAIGDYICNIEGSCIPFMGKPIANYLVAYAVVEMRKKIGEEATEEMNLLQKAEQNLERTWVGRENDIRVRQRNTSWYKRVTSNRRY